MNNRQKSRDDRKPKAVWNAPTLTIHGTVEQITQQSPPRKEWGGSDGATWTNMPVSWGS